MDKAELPET